MRMVTHGLILSGLLTPPCLYGADSRFREPVAIAVDNDRLLTANHRSGSISIIDIKKRRLIGEFETGGHLSAMAFIPNSSRLIAADEKNHKLILLNRTADDLKIVQRMTVPEYPVSIAISKDGRRCYVTSLWSRAVTIVELSKAGRMRRRKSIRLPFEPRKLVLAPDEKQLVVSGAFAGKLAIIDTQWVAVLAVRPLAGHNIRGLAVSANGQRLLVTLQSLNRSARSTFDDVHWGNMMVNVLYSFAIEDVCHPKADMRRDQRLTHLGAPESAAGDPDTIAISKNRVAIALSGVHSVGLAKGLQSPFTRITTGNRPSALMFSKDGKSLFVANRFSDDITVIDTRSAKRTATISLGTQPTLKPADLGRRLFYDARLSHDGWVSCHSCHTDGHSNGQFNDNLSDGSFGAPKRVLSLLGVAETGPWAWNGKTKDLKQQVRNSVTKTMRGDALDDKQVTAIVAFLKTLKPPPPISRFDSPQESTAIATGRKLFAKMKCAECHTPPLYTSQAAYDVGLKDENGVRRYNPPSLRGVGQRPALFHDGRAKSLPDVLTRFRHQLPRALSRKERDDVIAFLRSL